MLVYSPLYGSVILFVFYGLYLAMLSEGEQQQHLNFFVRLMCWFHVIFLAYWLLLFAGYVSPVPRADLLRSNSTAYAALFVVAIMLLYQERIRLSAAEILGFAAVNVGVIFANRTRGAILGLAAVLLYLLLRRLGWRRGAVLIRAIAASVLGLALLVLLAEETALTKLLGQDAGALGAVLSQIAEAYESGTTQVSVSAELVKDEGSLSAFSRIGSNFYSMLSFIDHPLLGIGQADSYAIDVIGSGVHSLHFLIANSTGLAGAVLFTCTLVALGSAQGPLLVSGKHALMLILCFGYMLVFVNSIPIYFALVLALLARSCKPARQLRGVSAPLHHLQIHPAKSASGASSS